MPEIEEMEYVPIGEEAKTDRFRGLRLLLKRIFLLLLCPTDEWPPSGEFPNDEEEEEVIEF